MDKSKIQKIIAYHNLDTKNLVEVKDDVIFIKENDILYKLDNINKTIVNNHDSTISNLISDYKDAVELNNIDKIKNDDYWIPKTKKPRGWALKKVFIDSEGNVYHKGKLQK